MNVQFYCYCYNRFEEDKMEYVDLKNEILELIERHAEGEYWDFKQQWHSNNADLLQDIICMANSPANRDCYIIIGVEDKTYIILGVNDENRKKQQNVIDLLRQKPSWAGGYIPEVYVKTISVDDKELDIIIIKQSDNTPFYLLEDYKGGGNPIFKGAIYTRKGDTNTPKTSTADLHDTELLWKRRFGLLYNPSQRAKYNVKDLENWRMVGNIEESLKQGYALFYYLPDPDYVIYFIYECDKQEYDACKPLSRVDENNRGEGCFYIYAFSNVSYYLDFSDNSKVILYYRMVPIYSSCVECIDRRRTMIVPPEFWHDAYYIKDSFRFLTFEFLFYWLCGNHSWEAKEMLMRVIPLYDNESEYKRFTEYIKDRGFSRERIFENKMSGEALKRLLHTEVSDYEYYGSFTALDGVNKLLKENQNLVINFANPHNREYSQIHYYLRVGKMLVDWLREWKNYRDL